MTAGTEWINRVKVARSAEKVLTATQTSAYLGHCGHCNRPVRYDADSLRARIRMIPCPDCGASLEGHRLAATTTTLVCDGSCMGAFGPICDCGCGGINHGAAWGFPLGSGLIPDYLLDKYRQHRAKVEAARGKRREARIARQLSEFQEWAEELWEFLEFLEAEDVGAAAEYPNDYLYEMQQMVARNEILTDRQLEVAARIIESRIAGRAKSKARAAIVNAFPKERMQITGIIARIDVREDDWGPFYKATVECEGGSVVLLRLPAPVRDWVRDSRKRFIYGKTAEMLGAESCWTAACKGLTLTFTATLKPMADKPWMAYANRPTKVTFDTSTLEEK